MNAGVNNRRFETFVHNLFLNFNWKFPKKELTDIFLHFFELAVKHIEDL